MSKPVMVEPISKTLPVGLCRNFATDGKGHTVCLRSAIKEASLIRCLSGRNCSSYDPEWYGFDENEGKLW